MYKKLKIHQLQDYFLPLSKREKQGIYFYRIYNSSEELLAFIQEYLSQAKRQGVILQGKIANPEERQLSYYHEIMGANFEASEKFVDQSLKKWLPRLSQSQRQSVVSSIMETLLLMQHNGKSLDIQKNAYIKFMCWMYYRFERILIQLGKENLPKVLYEGTVGKYELDILTILAEAGCDVLLLQTEGDTGYLKIDPNSECSYVYENPAPQAFPKDFSIAVLERKAMRENRLSVLYGSGKPKIMSTNTWLTGELFEDAQKNLESRGTEASHCYNLFVKMLGVQDKQVYAQDLFRWKKELEAQERKILVLSEIKAPENDEIKMLQPKNYANAEQILLDLTGKIKTTGNRDLDNQVRRAFVKILLDEEEHGINGNHLKNEAVFLICWFNRYLPKLFDGRNSELEKKLPFFIYFNVCSNQAEAAFLRCLSWIPMDIFEICPDRSKKCCLKDKRLFEQLYDDSLEMKSFPERIQDINTGTVAFRAEQELNTLLYQDSGLYRDNQYQKAEALILQTMCEEVYLLWDQELKYRPKFEVLGSEVVLPVLGARILGVKNRDTDAYWREIRKLCTEDTVVFAPDKMRSYHLSIRQYAAGFLKNKKLLRSKIKEHKGYMYGLYREETQEYVLDKIEELINQQLIKGTFVNGMEYTILAVGLSMEAEWMRRIQNFDFTKKNPKLLLIACGEEDFSLEDSILVALLSIIGFDVALFVPTGYRVLERNYTRPFLLEHQAGEFLYDLTMPALQRTNGSSSSQGGFLQRIFKRG